MRNQVLGMKGERHALMFCRSRGWRILETNWRAGRSEIDIIANDHGTTVFIEVKTRSSAMFGAPEESITRKKIIALRRAIAQYVHQHRVRKFRTDVIALIVSQGHTELSYIPDIDLLT